MDAREISSLVGILAFGLILFRLVSTARHTTALSHALAISLLAVLGVGAIAQWRISRDSTVVLPIDGYTYAVLATRVLCLFVGLVWPRLIDKRVRDLERGKWPWQKGGLFG